VFFLLPTVIYGQSKKELLKVYSEANKDYFENKLPPISIVFIKHLQQNGDSLMATTFCNDAGCTIDIDPDKNPNTRVAVMTLYHETCHVYLWDKQAGHGEKFENCMVRLAELGAFEGYW
jgi:hypothetical protein